MTKVMEYSARPMRSIVPREKTTTIASQMITHRLVVPGARHRMDMMKLTMPIISTSSA